MATKRMAFQRHSSHRQKLSLFVHFHMCLQELHVNGCGLPPLSCGKEAHGSRGNLLGVPVLGMM